MASAPPSEWPVTYTCGREGELGLRLGLRAATESPSALARWHGCARVGSLCCAFGCEGRTGARARDAARTAHLPGPRVRVAGVVRDAVEQLEDLRLDAVVRRQEAAVHQHLHTRGRHGASAPRGATHWCASELRICTRPVACLVAAQAARPNHVLPLRTPRSSHPPGWWVGSAALDSLSGPLRPSLPPSLPPSPPAHTAAPHLVGGQRRLEQLERAAVVDALHVERAGRQVDVRRQVLPLDLQHAQTANAHINRTQGSALPDRSRRSIGLSGRRPAASGQRQLGAEEQRPARLVRTCSVPRNATTASRVSLHRYSHACAPR